MDMQALQHQALLATLNLNTSPADTDHLGHYLEILV